MRRVNRGKCTSIWIGRKRLLPGRVIGRHYATDLLNFAVVRVCAAVVASAESGNLRAEGYKLIKAINDAAGNLKAYPNLFKQYGGLLAYCMNETHKGRGQVLHLAVEQISKLPDDAQGLDPAMLEVEKKKEESGGEKEA